MITSGRSQVKPAALQAKASRNEGVEGRAETWSRRKNTQTSRGREAFTVLQKGRREVGECNSPHGAQNQVFPPGKNTDIGTPGFEFKFLLWHIPLHNLRGGGSNEPIWALFSSFYSTDA